MGDVLIIGDTYRSPELRHEVPLGIADPFVYLERDGIAHVYIGSLEADRVRGLGREVNVHPLEETGYDELTAEGLDWQELRLELVARACAHAELTRASVPHAFPAGHLERLRRGGIELTIDQRQFDERRRVKAGPELAGIRRASSAAESGLAAGVSLLGRAENGDGVLWLDGEPLTVERIKAVMRRVFAEQGCSTDDFVVAPGQQGAVGHDVGHGPVRYGTPIVIDVWPRDDLSSCASDMTRTVVVGPVDDEVRTWHTLVKEALDASTALVRAGVECRSLYDAACDIFEAAGYPTQRTKEPGEVIRHGFVHALGHGVGLAAHEEPYLGLQPSGSLVAGDVIALEPGLYDPAVGGVRLEDLLLVTDDGCEVLTRFPYELEVPPA